MDCVHWGVGKCRGLAEALAVRSARAERQGSVGEAQESEKRARARGGGGGGGGWHFLMELEQLKSRRAKISLLLLNLCPAT